MHSCRMVNAFAPPSKWAILFLMISFYLDRYAVVGAIHRCNHSRLRLYTWTSQRAWQMLGVLPDWPGNRLFGARVRTNKWQWARARAAVQIRRLRHLLYILGSLPMAERHQLRPMVDSWVFVLITSENNALSVHAILFTPYFFEFRGWRGCNQLSEKSKFSIYFVYAWGLAFVFTLFAYLLDNHTDIVRIKPGIGEGSCFLKCKWISLMKSHWVAHSELTFLILSFRALQMIV